MAKKRLTDLEKWKKPFFKKLPIEYKLFWLYLLDDCDHCGIWHLDFEVAELRLGVSLDKNRALDLFDGRVISFDNDTKWLIPDFISFQYGELNQKNTMFKSIIPTLKKYGLLDGASMGDRWGINPPIVKVSVKEEVKEPELKNQAVGTDAIKTIYEQVWENQYWKEQTCIGNNLTPENLQKWMARFNASVMNDYIPDFDQGKYQKMFPGWLRLQISKGVTLDSPTVKMNDGRTLKLKKLA